MTTTPLRGLRVAVAGAGVLGLSIGALAARRGARVVVFDPAARADNASGVAAGMLSPALETVLEGGDAARYALFHQAYAGWPGFASAIRLPLPDHHAGAVQLSRPAMLGRLAARLGALGVAPRPLTAAEVRAAQPLYGGELDGLHVAADGRLDPAPALQALARALVDGGGQLIAERLAPRATPRGFDRLVIAAGDEARAWAEVAPEAAALFPIKGHILHYASPRRGGPALRSDDGYLVPQGGGLAFGATMEGGRADRAVDAEIAAALHRRAVALAPGLEATPRVARAGVRAATRDGLPLVGASSSGPILAVGARRNGWLLAPLVAEAALQALEGAPSWAAFDPARFGPF